MRHELEESNTDHEGHQPQDSQYIPRVLVCVMVSKIRHKWYNLRVRHLGIVSSWVQLQCGCGFSNKRTNEANKDTYTHQPTNNIMQYVHYISLQHLRPGINKTSLFFVFSRFVITQFDHSNILVGPQQWVVVHIKFYSNVEFGIWSGAWFIHPSFQVEAYLSMMILIRTLL